MSNINELNKRIAILNAECQRVNNERAVNLGKKDTLTKQLESAIKSYNEKYGKNITVDSINTELESVVASKEKEVAAIEAVLEAIKLGDYEKANSLSGVGVETVEEVAQPASVESVVTPPASVVEEPKEVVESIPTPPVVQTPPIAEPVAPSPLDVLKAVTQPQVSEPVAPPTPVVPSAPSLPTPPASPALATPPSVSVEPKAPSAPSGLKMPEPPSLSGLDVSKPDISTPSAPTSFSAILGGTAFNQN